MATIVFLRTTTFGYGDSFLIVDHAGRFVGQAVGGYYFGVRSPPGEYVFIVGDEKIDVLYANVAPGLTYYVNVLPVPGSLTVEAKFQPVRPGSPAWQKLPGQLRYPQLVPDLGRGQRAVDHDPELRARIERAKKLWAGLSPEERAGHSLGPADGAAPPPAYAAPVYGFAPAPMPPPATYGMPQPMPSPPPQPVGPQPAPSPAPSYGQPQY